METAMTMAVPTETCCFCLQKNRFHEPPSTSPFIKGD